MTSARIADCNRVTTVVSSFRVAGDAYLVAYHEEQRVALGNLYDDVSDAESIIQNNCICKFERMA